MRLTLVLLPLLCHSSIPVDSFWIDSADESLKQPQDISEEESIKNSVASQKIDTFSNSGTVKFDDSRNSSIVSQLHDSQSLGSWERKLVEERQVNKKGTPKPSKRKPIKSPKPSSPSRRTSKPTIASSEGKRCPIVPTKGCSICGTNRCVTKPESVFSFPNQPSVQCGILEQGGLDGLVKPDICAALPEYVSEICGCLDFLNDNEPPPSCPAIPSNGCSVCGEGKCVSKPNEIFSFPNQPDIKCDLLQQGGLDGRISSDTCVQISELIQDVCGCTTPKPVSPIITSCPKVPSNGCSVCGIDKCITNPQNIFSFPNQPDIKCDLLQQGGLDGRLSSGTCVQISELIQDVCGCTAPKPLPTLISSCPNVPSNGCSVCGGEKCITKPQNVFSFPNQPDIKCNLLQQIGLYGRLSSDTCIQISELIQDVCGCTEPLPLPTPTKTCPVVPENGCSVCGTNKCISNPQNIFSFPNQPDIKCDLLQQGGLDGRISSDTCLQISELIQDVCGCTASKPVTCPVVPSKGCSICGPGKCISTASTFSVPGQPSILCTDLQRAGLDGVLDATDCALLPSLVDKPCGCIAGGGPKPTTLPTLQSPLPTSGRPSRLPTLFLTPPPTTGRPTLLPTPSTSLQTSTPTPSPVLSATPLPTNAPFTVSPTNLPTPAPTKSPSTLSPTASTTLTPNSGITSPPSTIAPVTKSGTPSPAVTLAPTSSVSSIACSPFQFQDGACSVCGSGMCVGLPDQVFSYPGQPSVLCGDLELAGYDGQIPLSLCPFLPSIIVSICGCRN